MLGQDFETFITNPILDKTLRALCFHILALEYLKDKAPRFEDVTDIDNLTLSMNTSLNCKPKREKKQEE